MYEKFPLILQHNNTKMQTKEDIKNELNKVILEIRQYLDAKNNDALKKQVNNKWSISQNIDHLSISNAITLTGLVMPNMILKAMYKPANRQKWNFDEVVWQYQMRLNNGAKAPVLFTPKNPLFFPKSIIKSAWNLSSNRLLKAVDKLKENDLDTHFVSHPLLGSLSLRELLFFTIYHHQHHLNSMKILYGN